MGARIVSHTYIQTDRETDRPRAVTSAAIGGIADAFSDAPPKIDVGI